MIRHVLGLCPTYNRPGCVANTLAQWRDQVVDCERHLIVFDDAGQYQPESCELWRIVSWKERCPTLGEKFDNLLRMAVGIALEKRWSTAETLCVVFEDDDVYLPNHIQCHIDAVDTAEKPWAAPSRIYANDGCGRGKVHLSNATGRYHGAWSYELSAALAVNGYPHFNGENGIGFDLVFGGRMRQRWGDPVDTTPGESKPHYIYRWGTASRNGSAFGIEGMLREQGEPKYRGRIHPLYDVETLGYYSEFAK